MKKTEKTVISNKYPHFVSFCNKFGFSSKKKAVISRYETGYSSIEDVIGFPSHIELASQLFPNLPLSKLSEVTKKMVRVSREFNLGSELDYYDTTYPSFTFSIPVTEVYEIYMQYQEYI